jgi:hypothetical protein
MAAGEIVAAHAVILLEMADDGFDGGAPAHLAADGLGDTPDLAADLDLEPVWIVVAAIALVAVDTADRDTCKLFEIGDDGAESVAIIWVAVQRLGMKHELPALGRGDVGIETLQPNSYGARALPRPMHSTSGACNE